MRIDEEYVKESMKKYLSNGIEKFTIVAGDEPPDYYVEYNNEKIILEVTRAEPIYLNEGLIQNRNTVDESIIKLCNQLCDELGARIDLNKSILLDIKGPLIKYIKFKNSIKNKIISILEDEHCISQAYEDWIEINVASNIIKVRLIDSSPFRKRIIGFISINNNKAIADIEAQASLILADRIRIKEDKTKIVNGVVWKGNKWLAILNNYWLASTDTYKRSIVTLKEGHTFSKIFLVEENFKVTEIYSN